jgi:hypothetical protein
MILTGETRKSEEKTVPLCSSQIPHGLGEKLRLRGEKLATVCATTRSMKKIYSHKKVFRLTLSMAITAMWKVIKLMIINTPINDGKVESKYNFIILGLTIHVYPSTWYYITLS